MKCFTSAECRIKDKFVLLIPDRELENIFSAPDNVMPEDPIVKYKALNKMELYYKNNPTLRSWIEEDNTCIFAFEGLGSGLHGKNTTIEQNYHKNYGYLCAMMVVTKGKDIVYVTRNASTLSDERPNDYPKSIEGITTLMEGIYNYNTGYHNGYTALCPSPAETPGWYLTPTFDFYTAGSLGVNIHASGQNPASGGNANSQGCQTVYIGDYFEFGKKVGFLNNSCDPDEIPTSGITKGLRGIIGIDNEFEENVSVKYILDRSYDEKNWDMNPDGVFYPLKHTCIEKCTYC